MNNNSHSTPSIGNNSSHQSRSLVRLMIGNVSKLLPEKTSSGFTHRWTIYVRAVGPEQFTDRSFIRKVVFRLHESFANPEREIINPPFEITESGFGSFDMVICIYFAVQKKSFKINYNLDLLLDSDNKHETEYKIEVANPSPEFSALIPKYCRASNKQRILPQLILPAHSSSNGDTGTALKQKSIPRKESSTLKPPKDEKKQKHQSSSKDSQIISKKVEEVINSPNKILKKEDVKKFDEKEKATAEMSNNHNKKKSTHMAVPKKRIPPSTDCESDSVIRDLFEANLPSTSNKTHSSAKKEEKHKDNFKITNNNLTKDLIISKSSEDKEKYKKEKIIKESKKKECEDNKYIIEREKERNNSSKKVLSEKRKSTTTNGNVEEIKKIKIDESVLPKKDNREEKKSLKEEKINIENEKQKEKIEIKKENFNKIKNKHSSSEKDKKEYKNNEVIIKTSEKKEELLLKEKDEVRKEKKEEKKLEKKKQDKDKRKEEKVEKTEVDPVKIVKISEKKTVLDNFIKKQNIEKGKIEGINNEKILKNSPNKLDTKERLKVEEQTTISSLKKEGLVSPKLAVFKQYLKQTLPLITPEKTEKWNNNNNISNNIQSETKKRKSDKICEDFTKIEKKKIIDENKRKEYYLSSSSLTNSPIIKPPKIAKEVNEEITKINSFEQIVVLKKENKTTINSSPKSSISVFEEISNIKNECQENNEEEEEEDILCPPGPSYQQKIVNVKIDENCEDSSSNIFVLTNRIDNLRQKLDLLQENNILTDENTDGGTEEELLFKCCEILLKQGNEGIFLNFDQNSVDFDFEKLPIETLNELENLLV